MARGGFPLPWSVSLVGAVDLKPTWAIVPSGWAESANSIIFLLFKLARICKLPNQCFLSSKFLQALHEGRTTHYKQRSFWKKVQIQNRIRIKNPGTNCF
jgi:hypothetical protein